MVAADLVYDVDLTEVIEKGRENIRDIIKRGFVEGKEAEEIEKDVPTSVRRLRRRSKQRDQKQDDVRNLYLAVVSELSSGTRNTENQIKYLQAYETALGVFRETALKLRDDIKKWFLDYCWRVRRRRWVSRR